MAFKILKELKISSEEKRKIDEIIEKNRGREGFLLTILEEIQEINKHKYLPSDVLEYISMRTNIPLSRIYNVVTFYSFFNLKPQGEHLITVCRGTACHTKGSKSLLLELAGKMNFLKELESGENSFTTKDNKFTIQTVACFGQCALAPVVAIDGVIYSNMTSSKLNKLISSLMNSERRRKK